MSTEVVRHLGPRASVGDAIQMMDSYNVGCVVVMDRGTLAGMFTERDLVRRVLARGLDPEDTTLSEVMTRDPDTIAPNDSVDEVIRRMDEFGYRHMPVVERGTVVGLVSLRDCSIDDLAAMAHELEDRRAIAERAW
ncbi:MAG: CBS domain-containing protein [Geminicoccaceae bacterium]|nr:CBS domain-containing protein [Geminicoccaceae bacterium]